MNQGKGNTVHFASLMDICHLKNSELEPEFQKYRSRTPMWPGGWVTKACPQQCANTLVAELPHAGGEGRIKTSSRGTV